MRAPRVEHISLILGTLVMACLTAACGREHDRASAPPTAVGVRSEMVIAVDSLAMRLEGRDGPVVLHVARARAEFDSAHVPGATFLPLGAILIEGDGLPNELPPRETLDSVFAAAGVSDTAHVVVYGEPLAAARAYVSLDVLGHGGRTALLDGGLAAWRRAGHQVSSGSGEPDGPEVAQAGSSEVPSSERIVDADWIEARRSDAGLALIDARPPEEFSGEKSGEGVARPGHIPGARNLFWKTLLESDSLPLLRDTATLRSLFVAAGAAPGDTVVTYCRTGMQASYAYFVARYLGYEARMYDGSFIDWARVPARAVEAGPDAAGHGKTS